MVQELTIANLKTYAELVSQDDIKTIDDVVKETGYSIESCWELHGILNNIAEKVKGTRAYKSRESLESQLRLIDAMIGSVDIEELSHQDRQSVLTSLSTASKLRIELENIVKIGDQSETITAILKILFDTLSAVDPVIAIKVRDACVEKFDSFVSLLPIVPGVGVEVE